MLAKASIIDLGSQTSSGSLPAQFQPSLPPLDGSEGVVKSYILPDGKTGVMFVGSFEPSDFFTFQADVQNIMNQFQTAGVTQLLIDVTDNGGAS